MNTKDFEEKFMQLISGQMPVPQSLFRQFLDWLQKEVGDSVSAVSSKQDISSNQLNTPRKSIVPAINDTYEAAVKAYPIHWTTYDENTGKLILTIGNAKYAVTATEVEE